MSRTAGRRGRLPVKPDGEKFALKWAHEYAAGPLPAPQYPVDVSSGISDWGMDGNDRVGDCTFAGRLHYQLAKAATGGEAPPAETADQLVAEYFAYTHGQDVGANIADLLLYWYHKGTILAFAPVDHTDPAQCDAAMAAFHGLYCGVDLTDDADDLFEQGQPWTIAHGELPDPSEGHCVLRVTADGSAYDGYVTWGAIQQATREWSGACLEEAWVIITPEDAEAANLDIAALRADIDTLGGTGGDSATAPHPHVPFLTQLADEVEAIAARVRDFLGTLG